MKKRMAALLLIAVMLFSVVPKSKAIGTLWFVAVNDSIPLTMTGDSEPFYLGSTLYIPYSAYNAYPGGVVPAYDTDKRTFALFTRYQRLVYNLATDTLTDEDDNEKEVSVIYRNGVLFVPYTSATHFGLSVNLLYSSGGYPVLRFKTGAQVYDDQEFLERADSVINYRAENSTVQKPEPSNPGTQVVRPPEEEEPLPPIRYYPVLWGDAVSRTNLDALEKLDARAAFYLTKDQILENKDLVCAICCGGHTIGLTVLAEETEIAASLSEANEALDTVIFSKTLMVLLHEGQQLQTDDYLVLSSIYTAKEGSTEQILLLSGNDEAALLKQLISEDATFLQLRENTQDLES